MGNSSTAARLGFRGHSATDSFDSVFERTMRLAEFHGLRGWDAEAIALDLVARQWTSPGAVLRMPSSLEVLNRVRDLRRSESRRHRREAAVARPESVPPLDPVRRYVLRDLRRLGRHIAVSALRAASEGLPPGQIMALRSVLGGRTLREVAGIYGESRSTWSRRAVAFRQVLDSEVARYATTPILRKAIEVDASLVRLCRPYARDP